MVTTSSKKTKTILVLPQWTLQLTLAFQALHCNNDSLSFHKSVCKLINHINRCITQRNVVLLQLKCCGWIVEPMQQNGQLYSMVSYLVQVICRKVMSLLSCLWLVIIIYSPLMHLNLALAGLLKLSSRASQLVIWSSLIKYFICYLSRRLILEAFSQPGC